MGSACESCRENVGGSSLATTRRGPGVGSAAASSKNGSSPESGRASENGRASSKDRRGRASSSSSDAAADPERLPRCDGRTAPSSPQSSPESAALDDKRLVARRLAGSNRLPCCRRFGARKSSATRLAAAGGSVARYCLALERSLTPPGPGSKTQSAMSYSHWSYSSSSPPRADNGRRTMIRPVKASTCTERTPGWADKASEAPRSHFRADSARVCAESDRGIEAEREKGRKGVVARLDSGWARRSVICAAV
mmetsp:Transcript_20709/g.70143  ORF Transcript_20709/g.70143 Transcript_20709/m.70143 type:complete len:252 (+) Transcript_20709:813-1568(+)